MLVGRFFRFSLRFTFFSVVAFGLARRKIFKDFFVIYLFFASFSAFWAVSAGLVCGTFFGGFHNPFKAVKSCGKNAREILEISRYLRRENGRENCFNILALI